MPAKNSLNLFVFLSLCSLPLVAIYFPRALAFLPVLIGLIAYSAGYKHIKLSRMYVIWAVIISALALLSSVWSVDRAGSLEEWTQSFPVILLGVFLVSVCLALPLESLRPYLWVFPLCLSLAAAIIATDLALDLSLYRMTRGLAAETFISTAVMNRGIVTIILSLFAGIAFLRLWDGTAREKFTLGALLGVSVLVMLVLTQSQSAQLAVFVGLFFFLLFPYRWKRAYSLLLMILLVLVICAPWISLWMWDQLAFRIVDNPWLSEGYAANRMEIWGFVSERIFQSPIYGFGLEATKLIGAFDHKPIFQHSNTILHPHNFALQIWIEFGFVGVLCFGFFMTYILLFIRDQMTGLSQRVALASFMAVLSVSAVGYGIWQGWWLGLLIYVLFFNLLVRRVEQNSCKKATPAV